MVMSSRAPSHPGSIPAKVAAIAALPPLAQVETIRQGIATQVFALASEVLGSENKARQWVNDQIPALGGKRPLDLLDTDLGTQEVMNLLQCIKWGMYA